MPFLISAALAATTLSASSAFTDQGPPPPRTNRERLLVDFDRGQWTVDEFIIRTDGSRRFLSRFTVECGDLGGMVEYMLFMEAQGPIVTPEQKKKQLEQEAIDNCCGASPPGTDPCEEHCGCLIIVYKNPDGSAGGSSTNCICAFYQDDGECPDDWPPELAF